MDTNALLYITFIIYIMVISLGFIFKVKWLFMIGGILWFVPITQIDNIWIILVSVVVMIVHFILGFYEPRESEF